MDSLLCYLQIIACGNFYSGSAAQKVICLGNAATAILAFFISISSSMNSEPEVSLSQQYINQYMEENPDLENICITQSPAHCASGDLLSYSPWSWVEVEIGKYARGYIIEIIINTANFTQKP
ncbi:MAG: hypothetical protein MRQ10_00145 [Candidatus Midichloria mitochondrii]|nr:hypothetical protein [Candidatus Midichloria mitochondrii]